MNRAEASGATPETGADVPSPSRGWRRVAAVLLVVQGGLALEAWWLLPHGFSSGHPRFWSNQVVPWLAAGVAAWGVAGLLRGRPGAVRQALLVYAAAWAGGAVALVGSFPVTGWAAAALALGGAASCGGTVVRGARYGAVSRVALAACAALGAVLGPTMAVAQRPPPPTTRPLGDAPAALRADAPAGVGDAGGTVAVGSGCWVAPGSGRVRVEREGLTVVAQPFLGFHARSPDGFWTVFAPPEALRAPSRRLLARREVRGGAARELLYEGLGRRLLRVGPAPGGFQVEAWSEVPRPVASHLNTYAEVLLTAEEGPLRLVFSPCPETPVEVRPMDYPVGRPARLAYLDRQGTFRVVEATSGEKGPFRTLTAGALGRGDPLAVTVLVGERPAARLVFADWAAQASTAPSPTAGWGLPQNALELRLLAEEPRPRATLFLTLAATSVGRGWDSVTHTAGVYRNRVRIEEPDLRAGGEARRQAGR